MVRFEKPASITVIQANTRRLFPTLAFSALLGALSFIATAFAGEIIEWPTSEGGNGHTYEGIIQPGVTWSEAKAAAEQKGGYLVTITSAAENDFLFKNFVSKPQYWVFGFDAPFTGEAAGPWIGASKGPSGGWQWVNNEGPMAYSNWLPGEPNDYQGTGESVALFFDNTPNDAPAITSQWNDWPADLRTNAYIIEYDNVAASLTIVVPGCVDNGAPLKGLARMLLGCENDRCEEIDVIQQGKKPDPADVRKLISDTIKKPSNDGVKHYIVNVNMTGVMDKKECYVRDLVLGWPNTRWAGTAIDSVATAFREQAPTGKRSVIAHSAGAMAVYFALSQSSVPDYDEINILNGRANAHWLASAIRGKCDQLHVRIYTTAGDTWGLPCLAGQWGNIANAQCARSLSPGTWVHLHATASADGSAITPAHTILRDQPAQQFRFQISPATVEDQVKDCYSVIGTINNVWEEDLQPSHSPWSHCPQR